MKIVVKPSLFNLEDYIKRGASAFLFGINSYSLNGSGIVSLEELKDITKKYLGKVEIFVRLDNNYFNKDIKGLKEILKELEILKITGVFFCDLGLINLVKENNLNINLVWNQNYLVTNSMTCNYYYNMGIKSGVLTTELTANEMALIANNTKMDLFVNLFGYQMMAVSKRKFVSHYFDFIKEEKKEEDFFFIEKDNSYQIKEDENGTIMLSNYVLNGLSKVKMLKEANIKYIIIDSINIFHGIILDIIEYYKKAVISSKEKDLLELDFKVKELVSNTSLGFLEEKTIFQVKNHE